MPNRYITPLILLVIVCSPLGAQTLRTPGAASRSMAAKLAVARAMPAYKPECDPHPGTAVSCAMSLQQAVDAGIADLSSKGQITGDEVAITVRNNAPAQCPVVKVQLFIEFYGSAATDENVKLIVDAIQNVWNGRTSSDGRSIQVEVVARVSPNTSAPNTKGFHQVELVDHDVRDVVNGLGTDYSLNKGTGSATWSTGGEDNLYAHEAGHFMGFPDYYDDYDKLSDGTFKSQTDGSILTRDQLAQQLSRTYPNKNLSERQQLLDGLPVGKGVSLVQPGHEGDLMGSYVDGTVKQWSIDALAGGSGGILITVDPGTIMMSKDPTAQSVVITHTEYLYVGAGQTKTCGGLYASCIDGMKKFSDPGTVFDVAPPLDQWPSGSAVSNLAKLTRYIDRKRLYDTSYAAQEAIWRLTDNETFSLFQGNRVLLQAGIDVRDTMYSFPHPVDPDTLQAKSVFTLPAQLVQARMSSPNRLVQPGTHVQWSGTILRPSSAESAYSFAWTLEKPDSSSAALAGGQTGGVDFTADKRGIYWPRATIRRKSGGSPYQSARSGAVVAADAMTETFESGALRRGAPFFWGVSSTVPWEISDWDAFSGRYALHSGNTTLGFDSASDLGVRVILPEPGDISFTYRAGSGTFLFMIDGFVEELFGVFDQETGWQYATFHVKAGQHDLVWEYSGGVPLTAGGSMLAPGAWIDDIFFPPKANLIRTDAGELSAPAAFSLSQNYPNPFSGETAIRFTLPASQNVSLVLYDVLGHEVRRLADGPAAAGTHSVLLNTAGLAPGIYYYRLRAGNSVAGRKMVVMR